MDPTSINVEQILMEAVEIADPAERQAAVEKACAGNTELRAQVERLLANFDRAGSFLEHPAAVLETATVSSPEAPSMRIGPYKLLEVIGEGGMGTVWMAEQLEPVQRKVALKIIKAGMDSRQVIARFEAERQALALMDHPNIAKVFDAGTIASEPRRSVSGPPQPLTDLRGSEGRPYFVMELVKGESITKYCNERRLTPRQRLELFLQVCLAIQHAHQKGVIHRDIKASNVLIAPFDGKPVVKVIDFGIAKATGQRLTDKTLFTEFGAVVGTLEYMSPEQAELNNQDIDTRSDIYSLGVLLYELLTGTTPLDRTRLKQSAFAELLRMIREEEPAKPSARLSGSKDSLPSISAQRQMEPAKLTKLMKGELDWIVMKALDKDRNRRYETANGFAMDVQRYLSDEPVQACPPSAAYRLRKFARRNKGPLLAATLVLLALVAGIIGTSLGLVQANVAEADALDHARTAQQAHRNEEQERKKAEQATAEAQRQRKIVQGTWLQTLTTLNRIQKRSPAQGRPDTESDILREVYAALLGDDFAQSIEKEGASMDVRRETARGYLEMGKLIRETGGKRPASAYLLKAIPAYEKLNREHPNELSFRATLVDAYRLMGMAPQALNWANTMVSAHPREIDGYAKQMEVFAGMLSSASDRGDLDGELGVRSQICEMLMKWCASSPRNPNPQVLIQTLSSPRGARLSGCEDLGDRLRRVGRPLDAAKAYRLMIPYYEALATLAPDDARTEDLSRQYHALGAGLFEVARFADSAEAYRKAIVSWEKVPGRPAPARNVKFHLGLLYCMRGAALAKAGAKEEGVQQCKVGFALLKKQASELATDEFAYLVRICRWAGALDEAPDLCTGFLERLPEGSNMWPYEFAIEEAKAELLSDLGRFEEAGKYRERAVATYFKNTKPKWDGHEMRCYNSLAWFLATCPEPRYRNPARALALARKATEEEEAFLARKTNALGGSLPGFYKPLPRYGYWTDGENEVAWHKSLGFAYYRNLDIWNTLGVACYRAGDWKAALAALEKSMALRPAGNGRDYFFVAMSYWQLNEKDTAREWYDKGVAWMEKNDAMPPYRAGELRRFRAEAATLLGIEHKINEALSTPLQKVGKQVALALSLRQKGDVQGAIAAYREASRLQPGDPVWQVELGKVLLGDKQPEEAIKVFQKVIKDFPEDARAFMELGQTHAKIGKLGEAIESYREVVRLQPTDIHGHFQLALTLARKERWEEAIAAYEELLRVNPRVPTAYNNIAWLLATCPETKVRDNNRAVLLAKKATELAPREWGYLNTLGVAYYRAGNWLAAIAALEKANKFQGDNGFDYFFLAMARWQLGDKEQARKRYDQGAAWMNKHAMQNEELRRFRAEAADLLGIKRKSD